MGEDYRGCEGGDPLGGRYHSTIPITMFRMCKQRLHPPAEMRISYLISGREEQTYKLRMNLGWRRKEVKHCTKSSGVAKTSYYLEPRVFSKCYIVNTDGVTFQIVDKNLQKLDFVIFCFQLDFLEKL